MLQQFSIKSGDILELHNLQFMGEALYLPLNEFLISSSYK